MKRNYLFAFLAAALVTVPGLVMRLGGLHVSPPVAALISGTAIVGASFLLLWACDAAQTEVSQGLALAGVALIAVLPEYSVDMYFTWQAGKFLDGNYAHYAIANMTGANRLLIGVAWGLIVLVYWFRFRRDVVLEEDRRTELFFLGITTAYALFIPLKGTLAWYDGLIFGAIYLAYVVIASRKSCCECEPEGPAALVSALPKVRRRAAILGLFLFAGAVILVNAEPFCEGLIGTGRIFQINEFLLVQWLAPIASEAPEFIVALMFAWRGQAGLALGSLISAKLNQWTLLVGMIPGVYAVSRGSLAHSIPLNNFQMSEVLLTAAQSLLAVVLLAGLRLSVGGALLLFGLFAGQFVLPLFSQWFPGLAFGLGSQQIHPVFCILYAVVALALLLQNPRIVWRLREGVTWNGSRSDEQLLSEMSLREDGEQFTTPHCKSCKWRKAAQTGVPDDELIGAGPR
jgi:cation:H+ antiporter